MFSRRDLLANLAAAVAVSATAHAQAPINEFRIGYQKSGILVVARRQRAMEARLKALGIDSVKWVEFQYGPPLLEALGLGAIDFGTVGDTPPIFAQAAGANVVYVAASPASQSALIVPSGSPIRTLADVKGKKIALAKGSSSHNLTVQLLSKAGLTYADITPVYLNPADAAAAFVRGSVDGWTIWDPYFAIAERRQDARVIATSRDVADSNSFYLANRDFAIRHPGVLRAALDELAKVTAWAAENRDKLAAAIAEVTGVELEAQQVAVNRAAIDLRPVSDEIIAQQQAIAANFYKLGLIPKPIVVREAVWVAPRS